MPSVPRYSAPKVQEQALRGGTMNVNAPIEAFGGGAANGMGKAIQTAGGVISEIAAQEKKRADELVDQEMQTKLSEWRRHRLFDPESGALRVQGKDALDLPNKLKDEYEQFANELGKDLSGTQAEMFYRRKQEHWGHLAEKLEVHAFSEKEKYEDQTTQAYLQNMETEAVDNFADPKEIRRALSEQTQTLLKYADRKGLGAEWAQQKIQAQVSKTQFSVLERMLANNLDGRARQHYMANRDQFVGDDKIRAEKLLHTGTVKGESMRQADFIMTQAADLQTAMEFAKKIQDPDVRDSVESRLKQGYEIRKLENQQTSDGQMMASFRYSMEAGTTDAVPIALWQSLTPNQRDAIQTAVDRRRGIVQAKTDPQVYLKYNSMDIGALGRVSEAELMEKVLPYTSDEKFQELSERWQLARKGLGGDKKADAEFKSILNDKEMILASLKTAKVDGFEATDSLNRVTRSSKKAEAFNAFVDNVDNAFKAHFANHGKMPDDAKKKEIINGLLMQKVFVKDGWFGSENERHLKTLTKDQMAKLVIPEKTKEKLYEAARQIGAVRPNASPAEIERMLAKKLPAAYKAQLEGGSQRDIENILRGN